MAEEPTVLSFNSGRNCTRSDNGRKLRGSSDIVRQQQRKARSTASTVEATAESISGGGRSSARVGSGSRVREARFTVPVRTGIPSSSRYKIICRYRAVRTGISLNIYIYIYIYIHKQS
ncbi:hypothetical protein GW17_00035438 [Ensete ventricosum]|nr:hypothetical protein GW17_00035438 [Ensete ventricosum]RZR93247.1 hypothetical protein BHM03_00021707 [Ensete ventricosum]